MSKKNQIEEPESLEVVESAFSKTEQFIEDRKKMLTVVVIGVLVIIGAYLGYTKFYIGPLEEEVVTQVFGAEQYFEKDSFRLALEGDGNYLGFEAIIEEYGSTKLGNLSNYYAGISLLRLGRYEEAIDYLESFATSDKMIAPMKLGALGDCYMELDNKEKALGYYIKAAESNVNEFTTPLFLMKAGQVQEALGNYGKALETYQRIKDDFSKSNEGRANNIDKYIELARIKLGA